MKIKCIKTKLENPSNLIMNSNLSDFLRVGDVFWVYGMKFVNNVLYFYIFDGSHLIEVPLEMFEIIDDKVPNLWKIRIWDSNLVTLRPSMFYEETFLENFSEYEKKERALFEVLRRQIEVDDLKQLTYIESYKTMFLFLEMYFKVTEEGGIGSLLSDTMFYDEGKEDELFTADPASWFWWLECLHKIFPEKNGTKKGALTLFQAFKVMYVFLVQYEKETSYEDVKDILIELTPLAFVNEYTFHTHEIGIRWQNCSQLALNAIHG